MCVRGGKRRCCVSWYLVFNMQNCHASPICPAPLLGWPVWFQNSWHLTYNLKATLISQESPFLYPLTRFHMKTTAPSTKWTFIINYSLLLNVCLQSVNKGRNFKFFPTLLNFLAYIPFFYHNPQTPGNQLICLRYMTHNSLIGIAGAKEKTVRHHS